MSVEELIQLMRLSGTSKVRAYLSDLHKIAMDLPDGKSADFYERLCKMFSQCRRDSIADAWPTMVENESPPPNETQRPT